MVAPPSKPYDLSPMEILVVRRIVGGETDAEIARDLRMTLRAAQWHTRHAREKMDCHNRTQLAVKWVREQEHYGAAV